MDSSFSEELKNSLPALIVEILQERFDHDLVEYIDKWYLIKALVAVMMLTMLSKTINLLQ